MLKLVTGFLVGAASVAMVTVPECRRFAVDALGELRDAAREELRNASSSGRKKKETRKNESV